MLGTTLISVICTELAGGTHPRDLKNVLSNLIYVLSNLCWGLAAPHFVGVF